MGDAIVEDSSCVKGEVDGETRKEKNGRVSLDA